MFSVPPTRYSSPSPALMAAAAMASADALDAQTRLTVMAGTSSGMPAFSSAWRAVFWPRPAWMTLPNMTSSSCSPLTPARLSASVIAIAPSSTAGVLAKPPWKRPAGDLRAHVERVHLGIALQAVVPGEALHVHDGVDADRVRVALDGRADDAELAPELLLDKGVDGVVVHLLDLEVVPFDLVGIDAGVGAAVGHVKRVLGVDGLALGDAHGVEAELLEELLADVGGFDGVGDRQGEGELDDPVATSIAVRSC